MAFSVKYIYQAVDKFSAVADKMKAKAASLKAKLDSMSDSFEKAGKKMQKLGKGMTKWVSAPIIALGAASVIAAAKIETMEVAFESMLGSQEKAKAMTKELIDFTARTPFQLDGVASSAKQLLGFGVQQDQITAKLKVLGDIAAGANVPLTDMSAIFGKSMAKGKAMTEELLQMSDRGIPIIAVLSKQLSVSGDKVFEMASKSQISFDILEKALTSMTIKGGIFENQMAKQSLTLAGLWSTMKDNFGLMFAEFGIAVVETLNLKEAMTALTLKVQAGVAWFRQLSPMTKKFIVIATLLVAALGPLLIILGAIAMSITAITTALAVLFSPITLFVVAALFLGAMLVYAYNKSELFRKGIQLLGKVLLKVFNGIWSVTKTVFGAYVAYLKGVIKVISNTIGWIGKAIDKVKGFFGAANDNEVNIRVKKSVAVDEIKTSSNARVDMNINDPGNNVGSVNTTKSGPMTMNVGRNMQGATP